VEAVAYHHDPASCESSRFDLPTIVHVADALAHDVENERAGVVTESMLDRAHLARLGIDGQVDSWRELSRSIGDGDTP
jgi:hypothetical protein